MKNSHDTSLSGKIKKGLAEKGVTPRSLVAFVLFGMIVLVFVLSDTTGRQGGSTMGAAAEVNGELISLKDYQDEENKMAQYYSQLFGGQFDNEMQRNMIRGEVMNNLVNKSLAAQAAEKEGIYATDAEVRNMITQELPYFKKDGIFQSDAYKSILQANRLTPAEFESKLRQDIKNQRSRQLFESSLLLSDLQRNMEKQLRSSKINLEYVQLSAPLYSQAQPISTSELLLKLNDETFRKRAEEHFNNNKSQYESAEQVRASHILIRAENDEASKKQAEAVLKRLQKENFGQLASQLSADPGSKTKNGDLGYFARGQMVKEFEDAAFSLPVGETSGLVKSQFGYHIIRVTDKKPYRAADFEAVKLDIARKLDADERYLEFVKKVETALSGGQMTELAALLGSSGLKWKETGLFDIAAEVAPGMNSAQAIKLGLSLNRSEPLSKKLVREGDSQFIVRLKEVKTVAAELDAQTESMLTKQKSTEAYNLWINNFRKTAKINTNNSLLTPQ